MDDTQADGMHWSFWIIGLAALIWNIMGGINFFMQMNPDALADYPEAARALVEARPLWATSTFALGVFGGMLACLLLLLKKPAAYCVFLGSLFGVIVTGIHTFTASPSTQIWAASLMSLVVAIFLTWYAKRAVPRARASKKNKT